MWSRRSLQSTRRVQNYCKNFIKFYYNAYSFHNNYLSQSRGAYYTHKLISLPVSQKWQIRQRGGQLKSACVLYTHTHLMALCPGLPGWAGIKKVKTSLDFTEARDTRDSEWQWHQLDHMQVCTSVQTDNHAGTPPLSFLQAGCPSCRPTNSIKALKACVLYMSAYYHQIFTVFVYHIDCICIMHPHCVRCAAQDNW